MIILLYHTTAVYMICLREIHTIHTGSGHEGEYSRPQGRFCWLLLSTVHGTRFLLHLPWSPMGHVWTPAEDHAQLRPVPRCHQLGGDDTARGCKAALALFKYFCVNRNSKRSLVPLAANFLQKQVLPAGFSPAWNYLLTDFFLAMLRIKPKVFHMPESTILWSYIPNRGKIFKSFCQIGNYF